MDRREFEIRCGVEYLYQEPIHTQCCSNYVYGECRELKNCAESLLNRYFFQFKLTNENRYFLRLYSASSSSFLARIFFAKCSISSVSHCFNRVVCHVDWN